MSDEAKKGRLTRELFEAIVPVLEKNAMPGSSGNYNIFDAVAREVLKIDPWPCPKIGVFPDAGVVIKFGSLSDLKRTRQELLRSFVGPGLSQKNRGTGRKRLNRGDCFKSFEGKSTEKEGLNG